MRIRGARPSRLPFATSRCEHFPNASGVTPDAARETRTLPISPANWKTTIPTTGMCATKSATSFRNFATGIYFCTLTATAGGLAPNSCFTGS